MSISLSRSDLAKLSRREFLKLTSVSLLGLLCQPDRFNFLPTPEDPQLEYPLARVLDETISLFDSPSLSANVIKTLKRDEILPLTSATLGDAEPAHNRIWYQLDHAGFAHSSSLQPVKEVFNQPEGNFPPNGRVAEVTVPFTDAVYHYRNPSQIAFRLYYSSNHWIKTSAVDDQGQTWYAIHDDTLGYSYYAKGEHLHIITAEDISLISPDVPASERKIEVNIATQTMVCYEGDTPVYMAPVATGAKYGDKDLYTPKGDFSTNIKAPTRHMAHHDPLDPNSYDLPGVPWVIYLTDRGVAFHGTYWHNDYGRPRSHGCINLTPAAARWLYRWSIPVAPPTERLYMTANGTTVLIR